jgi:cyclic beta-1,2-glucan synthetase
VLSADLGDLRTQLDRAYGLALDTARPLEVAASAASWSAPTVAPLPMPAMTFANDVGGFTNNGREYVMVLDRDRDTPLPWVNVIANPRFGTIITSTGSAHTWAGNSRENRLTPFATDPVTDPTAEATFIRDDDTGRSWCPTPGPMPAPRQGRTIVSHGAGYSRFERRSHGIHTTLEVFVDTDDPVKFTRLTLTNLGDARRRLSVFNFNQLVLGPPRDGQQRQVVTAFDAERGIVDRDWVADTAAARVPCVARTLRHLISQPARQRQGLARRCTRQFCHAFSTPAPISSDQFRPSPQQRVI